ncbi:MAG: hypothetical protein U0166_01185 [Acidobacteriota bacterium]
MRRRRATLTCGLLMMGVLLPACSMARLESMTGVKPAASGEITVPWGTDGDQPFSPVECLSGDRANFRGVDLLSPTLIVRVVGDPLEGVSVAFIDPATGARHAVLRPSDCPGLVGDIQRTGWRVNHVADVSGFVEIDCLSPSGQKLKGRISFEHCH